jgi:hypothetical protein
MKRQVPFSVVVLGVLATACAAGEADEDMGESESLVVSTDSPKAVEDNGSRWTVTADALKLRKDTKQKNVDFSTLPVLFLLPQGTEVELACTLNLTSDNKCSSATYYRVKVTKAKGKVPAGATGYVAGTFLQRAGGTPVPKKKAEPADPSKLTCGYLTETGTAQASPGECRAAEDVNLICAVEDGKALWVHVEDGKHTCTRRIGEPADPKTFCGKTVINNDCSAEPSTTLRDGCKKAGGTPTDVRGGSSEGGFGTIQCECRC